MAVPKIPVGELFEPPPEPPAAGLIGDLAPYPPPPPKASTTTGPGTEAVNLLGVPGVPERDWQAGCGYPVEPAHPLPTLTV